MSLPMARSIEAWKMLLKAKTKIKRQKYEIKNNHLGAAALRSLKAAVFPYSPFPSLEFSIK
jgi:hypothetical protein